MRRTASTVPGAIAVTAPPAGARRSIPQWKAAGAAGPIARRGPNGEVTQAFATGGRNSGTAGGASAAVSASNARAASRFRAGAP
jgi:hypothetical protein